VGKLKIVGVATLASFVVACGFMDRGAPAHLAPSEFFSPAMRDELRGATVVTFGFLDSEMGTFVLRGANEDLSGPVPNERYPFPLLNEAGIRACLADYYGFYVSIEVDSFGRAGQEKVTSVVVREPMVAGEMPAVALCLPTE